jgi:hypothetical protein
LFTVQAIQPAFSTMALTQDAVLLPATQASLGDGILNTSVVGHFTVRFGWARRTAAFKEDGRSEFFISTSMWQHTIFSLAISPMNSTFTLASARATMVASCRHSLIVVGTFSGGNSD